MTEESTSRIKRNVLTTHVTVKLSAWLKDQGDVAGIPVAKLAGMAAIAMDATITGANIRTVAEASNVALHQRVKPGPSLAETVAALVARVSTLEEADDLRDGTHKFLARELLRVETFIALIGIEINGLGLAVSDDLRAMLVDPPVDAGNLFVIAPSETSEESAAL